MTNSNTMRDQHPASEETSLAALLASTAALGLAAASLMGAPAAAQDDPETIVVEGHPLNRAASLDKLTAPPLDMPQSMSVIPQELFNQQGARNLTDILRNTPGITFNAGENGFSTGTNNFSMRGFDASGSIFVDGARDSGAYSRDAFNLEQVEVVKGPSADAGRGGAGGFVNLVTKSPSLDRTTGIIGSFGFDEYDSENRGRLTADFNTPMSDTAAARLNLLLEGGGVPGRDVAERNSFGVAPSFAFGLGGPTRFTVALSYVQQNDVPDWGVPSAAVDGFWRRDPALDQEDIRDNFFGLSSDFDDVTAAMALARFERRVNDRFEFSSQLRWSDTERDAAYTVPTGYAPATQLVTTQRQAYARENVSLSWLNNFATEFSTGGLAHNAAFGLEFSNEESEAQAFPTPTGGTTPITAPNPDRAGPFTAAPTQASDVTVRTAALYFYDTVELARRWQLTGGLRAETYEVEIGGETIATGAPLNVDGYETSKESLSGRIGLVFKPVENASLYGAVGLAAQPPGSFLSGPDISREGDNAFPGFSAGINSEDADVQESLNYELGGKWDLFDGRLSTTAAVFRTERQNVAITGIDPTVTPAPAVALLGYGEQTVEGLEIGFAGQITPEWAVFGGALFMDSERTHSAFLDEGRRLASPGDYAASANTHPAFTSVLQTSGDELAFTPNESANLWTTYALPRGLTLGGGVQYTSDSWIGRPDDAERIIPNGAQGKLPSWWAVNLLAEYEVTDNVLVRLNVDNVTDEVNAVSTNWAAQRVVLGAPRSYLLSLQLRM